MILLKKERMLEFMISHVQLISHGPIQELKKHLTKWSMSKLCSSCHHETKKVCFNGAKSISSLLEDILRGNEAFCRKKRRSKRLIS